MNIERVRINGMKNPVGFAFDTIRCAWVVTETQAKCVVNTKIIVSSDKNFQHAIYEKEGDNLNPVGESLEVVQNPRTRYYIKVQVTGDNGEKAENIETVYFETGKMSEPWIGKWIKPQEADTFHVVFTKEFHIEKEVRQARFYISGLGLYNAKLNDKKVGKEILAPYFSDYHTECQYQTYDITDDVLMDNRIEVELGNGWYKGHFGLGFTNNNYGSEFQMIAEIHLDYTNGTSQIIASDRTWQYQGSDTQNSDIYNGEVINHLLWKQQDNPLRNALYGGIEGKLVERYSLPVTEHEEMKVKEVIHTPAGETVLDFGQNFAGYVIFHAACSEGTKIVLDFGEILQNGNFYNDNYQMPSYFSCSTLRSCRNL